MALIKTSGPVPLLALAVLFSVALFFVYKELSTLKAKVASLEKSVPEIVNKAVEQALTPPAPVVDGSAANAYESFADELPEFAEEAARAMSEAFAQVQFPMQTIEEEPVDITDVTDAPEVAPSLPEPEPTPAPESDAAATVVVKRRSKKSAE